MRDRRRYFHASRKDHRRALAAVSTVLGVLLIAAAAVKASDVASYPPAVPEGLLSRPSVRIGQIAFEAALGTWLLSGMQARAAAVVALGSFAVFTAISLLNAIAGNASCGCLGRVPINPWFVATFDICAVVALISVIGDRPHGGPTRPSRLRITASLALVLIGAGSTFYWVWRYGPAKPDETGDLPERRRVVYLEPADWVGKPFPLLAHNSLGSRIAAGQWVVVIYSSTCTHCRSAVPEFEQLSIDWMDKPGAPKIALLEVPPVAPFGKNKATGLTPALVGHLAPERQWFIITPAMLLLDDGKVASFAADQPPLTWAARVLKLATTRPAGGSQHELK